MSQSHEHEQGGMGARGVTRPMAEQEAHQHGHEQHKEHEHGGHAMTREDRLEMLQMHHKHTLWIYWTIIMLGCWVR